MSQAGPSQGVDRRVVRSNLRKLEEKAINDSEKLDNDTALLKTALKEQNEVFKTVEKPREHAMDAQLFNRMTQHGAAAAEKLVHAQPGRSLLDFITGLRFMHVNSACPQDDGANIPTAFNWDKLTDLVGDASGAVPGAACMLGAISVQAKVGPGPRAFACLACSNTHPCHSPIV
ncbi:hypothetical protein FOA52_015661 [Chlamydomonas sp. UWO 241]|nr:hypothetical protein FOA52_015661 [Chlamydomonas sp. UWO 241]